MLPLACELPGSADVVIIGGGVIGVATAYALARAGIDACLLERHDIGAGTSSAAAAAALLQTKTSQEKLDLAKKSLDLLDSLHKELDESFEYAHTGSLLAAASEAEMAIVHDKVGALSALGLDIQLIDGDEARRMMPVLGPDIIGASYSPLDAQINPLELVTAYAAAARRHGAKICSFTEVTGIERQQGRITGVQTNRGQINTGEVINAAGVWAPRIAEMVGVHLPIEPLKGEIMVTEPMPRMMQGTLISGKYMLSKARAEEIDGEDRPKRSAGITLVQVHHGNFIVGSTREQAGYDQRSSYAGISALSSLLIEIAPALKDVHIIRAYAGLRPLSADGIPIIGRAAGQPDLIIAAGYGGDGLVMSAISGEFITGIINGDPSPEMLDMFSCERFQLTA
jgi:glycine/D-amino acid oxidase-like deaminating enzyme